ncbi:MAG: DUF1570 domain-containing protein [Planctomycetia bacterium]|jgi:hypothetical protein
MTTPLRKSILTVLCLLIVALPAAAIDRVTFTPEKKNKQGRLVKLSPVTLEGRTLLEYKEGGRVFQTPDGRLWTIPSDWKPSCKSDDRPFKPLTHDELAEQLLKELPPGFKVYKTKHYLILYNTSRVYAKWCGALFERLYMAFQNFWKRKKLDLTEPEFPLVAIIFGNQRNYINYAHKELGLTKEQTKAIIGYYNIKTNLMVMSDLTNTSGNMSNRRRTAAQINKLLSRPGAAATTATIIHEATHQIAHNCGFHTRLADNPLWFVEGLALYFETPDLSSSKGWRTIGKLNPTRMHQFVKYARNRPGNSLSTLVKDDKRIRDLSLAENGYAESWALTYFLIRQRPKEYVEYVKKISDKKPYLYDTPKERAKTFVEVFGDPAKLDEEFIRYMSKQQ